MTQIRIHGLRRFAGALVLAGVAFGSASAAAQMHDPDGRIDPVSIPPLPADFGPLLPSRPTKSQPVTASFVDSQGRSLLYRLSLPAGANPGQPQPVMIYFHGNNSATQQQILDSFFPGVEYYAAERGVAAVVVASPQTRSPPQEAVRQWYEQDELTIQEFLSQRLPTHFAVDTRRIYFMGGSQGTCFLNDFMHSFGQNYGGGFFGGCGCFNSLDVTWTPPAEFVDGMKVYISSTRGDFLVEPSWNGYGLYKHSLGLDTRGDLDQEGAHCSTHWTQLQRALDWFTGRATIPEEPIRPHWSRISARADIRGLAITDDGSLWMTTHDTTNQRTSLRRSSDGGASWALAGETDGLLSILTANGMSLFAIDSSGALRRSDDGGQTFDTVANDRVYRQVVDDGAGTVYLIDAAGNVFSAGTSGSVRTPLTPGSGRFLHRDSVRGITAPRIFVTDSPLEPSIAYMGSVAAGGLNAMSPTPQGTLQTATWDGNTVFALARPSGNLGPIGFRSGDQGTTWEAMPVPAPFDEYYWYRVEVTALAPETVVANAGFFQSSWLTVNGGSSWMRLPGLATASGGNVIASGNLVVYSDGRGAFRLIAADLDDLFDDGFEAR